MNKILIFILTTTLCIIANRHSLAQDIAVVSYNIRLDVSSDNENNWHQRKADMVSYLKKIEADFIGLQEATGHQLDYLDQGLLAHAYLGVGRDDGLSGGEFSPILYDSTRWKVRETNTLWLSSTPNRVSKGWDAACHRVLTYGVFENREGRKVAVLNTHFDHVGAVARTESIRLINGFLTSFEKDMPIVLIGDFNLTPDDEAYKLLTSQLADSFQLSTDAARQVGTFNGFGEDSSANRRIDYVLLNEAVELQKYSVDLPKTNNGLQLSDHYPVIVNLKI